jgi:hypothetical protein
MDGDVKEEAAWDVVFDIAAEKTLKKYAYRNMQRTCSDTM